MLNKSDPFLQIYCFLVAKYTWVKVFVGAFFYTFFITSAEGGDAIDEENVAAFRFGKVVFADAADLKPNHEHPSLTLERALQHLLRLQCNDHQTETSRDKRKRGILRIFFF